MFRNEKPPFPLSSHKKFNPLQKFFYTIIMYLFMPFLIFTGLALMLPEMIVEKTFGFNGISLTAVFHSMLGFLVSLFLVIHLYAASVGKNPFANFKSIITGWHHVQQ